MDRNFLRRVRIDVTLVGGLICRHHLVEDEDPGVDIYVDIDTAVRHEHLESGSQRLMLVSDRLGSLIAWYVILFLTQFKVYYERGNEICCFPSAVSTFAFLSCVLIMAYLEFRMMENFEEQWSKALAIQIQTWVGLQKGHLQIMESHSI